MRFAVKDDSIDYISLRRVNGNEINEVRCTRRINARSAVTIRRSTRNLTCNDDYGRLKIIDTVDAGNGRGYRHYDFVRFMRCSERDFLSRARIRTRFLPTSQNLSATVFDATLKTRYDVAADKVSIDFSIPVVKRPKLPQPLKKKSLLTGDGL